MPTFTTGIFLLASMAIVIPIALHLLHRRKPQPMMFGAVRFLRDAIARSRRSRRLTQGLALLLRCLILLLLATAFARPFLRGDSFLPEGKRRILLVLDGSASMQAGDGELTRFQLAKRWLDAILQELADGDAVGLLVTSESGNLEVIPPVTDHEHVRAVLADAVCSEGWVNLPQAIVSALKKDGGTFKNFELHVFSDFQRGSWERDGIRELEKCLKERECAVFLNRPEIAARSDAGVEDLRFSPPAIAGETPFSCAFKVACSEDFSGSLTVKMTAEDKEQDQMTTVLPGGPLSDRLTGLAAKADAGTDLTGCVSIDRDGYALNDQRYFSLERLSGMPALLVNGSSDPRDSFFLRRAMKPTGASFAYLEPREMDWAAFVNAGNLDEFTMIFVCNPPPMDDAVINRLRQYVEEGGLVALFPGSLNGLSETALRRLTGISHLQVKREMLEEPKTLKVSAHPSARDALTRRLVKMLPPPWELTLRQILRITCPQKYRTFLEYHEKELSPQEFVVRNTVGNGELFVSSVSANRDWSDLPLTPFYFVLVQEVSRYGAGFRHGELAVAVGEELVLPRRGGEHKVKTLKAYDPSGHAVELQGALSANGKTLLVSGFHKLGIYAVELPWGEVKKIAVNLPDAEGMLTNWKRQELEHGWLEGMPVAVSASHEELKSQMAGLTRNHPLAPWLLLAAFVLSMAEVLYANLRSRKPGQPKLVEGLLKHGGGVA